MTGAAASYRLKIASADKATALRLQTVAVFSARLQNSVDLDVNRDDLTSAVQ